MTVSQNRRAIVDSGLGAANAYGRGWGSEKLTSVGAGGFEPPTFWSQTRRATGLRYAPMPHNLVNAVFWCTRQFDPRCGPATPSHFQAHQRVFPAHACNTTAGTELAQSIDGGHRMGRAVAVAGLTLWLMPLPGHVPNVASAAGQQPVRSPAARVLVLSDQARRFLLLQYRGFPTEFMGCMIGEVQGQTIVVQRIAPADVDPTQSTATWVEIGRASCRE